MESRKMSSLQEYLDEYELLTPNELLYVANGCGPKFGFLDRFVPDFCGLYTPACNLHDWLYWSGGPKAIKELADRKFRRDLKKTNSSLSWRKRLFLLWVPSVYYWGVKTLGKVAYYRASYRRTREDLRKEMRDATI
jgi:hypothetical protein